MKQPTFDHFSKTLQEYGIPDAQILDAWSNDSGTKAVAAVRFTPKRVYLLMEAKEMFSLGLGLKKTDGWEEIFAAWQRREK
jgi:hypothetical protein